MSGEFWLGLVAGVIGTLFVCATLFVWWAVGIGKQ